MSARNVEAGHYLESDFTRPRPDCPNPVRWHAHDIQGTEKEVIEMVAGIIRGIQPDVCLETGTSRGFMTLAIAKALQENGHGVIHTYEPDIPTLVEAHNNWLDGDTDFTLPIIPYAQESMSPWSGGAIDFAWFDSLVPLRLPEFEFYSKFMHANTVVGFHDTAPHFGDWSEGVMAHPRLDAMRFPTPRGMILARYKP